MEQRTVWPQVTVAETLRRSRLFIGSYAVLFLLLALRFRAPWLEAACAALALVGVADMVWIVYGITARTGAEPVTVAEVHDAGPEVAGYLATYLLPFLTVSEPSGRDITAYAIFLLVTGLIYVRSEMTQINPTLYLLRCRVISIRTSGGWSGHLVARDPVEPGMTVRTVPLNGAVRVEVRQEAQSA